MDSETFKANTKKWINHKFMIAHNSTWYKQARQSAAIANIRERFNAFLLYPTSFSAHNLAVLLKRHEDLLLTILPIPKNPSYEQAFNSLAAILKQANDIIEANNLKHMV